jgi:hypothetical protein
MSPEAAARRPPTSSGSCASSEEAEPEARPGSWVLHGVVLGEIASLPPSVQLALFGMVVMAREPEVWPGESTLVVDADPPEPRRARTALGSGVVAVAPFRAALAAPQARVDNCNK